MLGEFGQVRESYGRLRAIHLLCQTFSGLMENTRVVLPDHSADIQPEDLAPLRFSVRVKDDSGFLFVNNFQDHVAMHDRAGEEVCLQLASGDITFRFDIAAGENAILPFNLMLGGEKLRWATAQPLVHLGDTWFFLAPDGMTPAYCFGDETLVPDEHGVARKGALTIVTLTRTQSLGFTIYDGKAYLSDNPLLHSVNGTAVETEDGTAAVSVWANGAWETTALGAKREKISATFRPVGRGRYVVDVPQDMLQGHKQVLLRLRYAGDIGHAFINGHMINDNFCNGAPWDVRLDCYAAELAEHPLTIYITPIKAHVTVDVSSAMAGRMERAEGLTAELFEAEIVAVDEISVG